MKPRREPRDVQPGEPGGTAGNLGGMPEQPGNLEEQPGEPRDVQPGTSGGWEPENSRNRGVPILEGVPANSGGVPRSGGSNSGGVPHTPIDLEHPF